ncbi:hypothetical protein D3C73_1068290 [compost metagenome]
MTTSNSTTVINTPDGMQYAGYATLKSQLKMEKIGMSHSAMRGKKLRPMWAAKLGLKPRDSYEMFIAECQKRMDELLEKAKQAQ